MHIAHQYDDDNEPWHIQIEDHDGHLHSVALEEGQVISFFFHAAMFFLHLVLKRKVQLLHLIITLY